MTNTDTEREMVSDADIQAMLEAFSGSAEPVLSRARRRHHMTRRALIFVAAGLAILGLVVPGSLALVGTFSETPQQFINDENQPLNAREVVEQYMTQLDRLNSGATTRQRAVVPTLSSVQRVVTANTPEGEYGVYALGFSDGTTGIGVISSATGDVAGLSVGIEPCPPGWTLEAGGSTVRLPGTTPLYITGRASAAVASIDVVYPDGHSTPAAVSNGYFLAWVVPLPGAPNARTGFSPPVTLVARDSAGNEIGHLSVRGDGDIPPSPGQSAQAPACG
ncbi:MAG TPA: hypothetical protein VFA44_01615 [Gaiellaceae bacterium]|nr:hypothetical protein [Gaiellaceae bacterium]